MYFGKKMRLIAASLLVTLSCQVMVLAGSNVNALYHTTSGERTTVMLKGAATVPFAVHQLDARTVLIDLPGASVDTLQQQYLVNSPSVRTVNVERLKTPSGDNLARLRVQLNTGCAVRPVVRDGMLVLEFAPQAATTRTMPVTYAPKTAATVVTAAGAVALTEGVMGFIEADGPMQYRHFTTEDGKRVVFDITGVREVVTRKSLSVDSPVVKGVRVGQFSSTAPQVARVVFDVTKPTPYSVQVQGNRLQIKFATPVAQTALAAPALPVAEVAPQTTQPSAKQAPAPTPAVNQVAQATPPPAAKPAQSQPAPAKQEEPRELKLNRKPVQAEPPAQPATQPTAQKPVDSKPAEQKPTMVEQRPAATAPEMQQVRPLGGTTQTNQTTVKNPQGKSAVVDSQSDSGSGLRVKVDNTGLQPVPQSRTGLVNTVTTSEWANPAADSNVPVAYGHPKFLGEEISLSLKQVDIREVTNMIAANFGINFVYDRSVGSVPVTVTLTEVPWNQVLDQLLKANELSASVEGPMVRILTTNKLETEEVQKRKLEEARLAAKPLETKIIRLQYQRVDGENGGGTSGSPSSGDLGGGSGRGRGGDAIGLKAIVKSRLSMRGRVEIDPRSNSLIITDVKDYLEAAADMIAQLDRPERQVEIELRIVRVNNEFTRDLGNQMATSAANSNSGAYGGFSNKQVYQGNGFGGGSGAGSGISPSPFPQNGVKYANGVAPAVGLPNTLVPVDSLAAAGASSLLSLTTGFIGTSMITSVLSMHEQLGNAKVVSSPRLSVQNNATGVIESGIRLPVQTISNNTISTIFVTAALRLQITPMITDTGEVQLRIIAENDQPLFSAQVLGIPSISTQRAETFVRIPDGGTTIFGGVAVNTDSKTEYRTPGVAKLPIIGNLFKRRQTERRSDEILFFVTPRIFKPQVIGLDDLDPASQGQKENKANPTPPRR